MTAWILKEHHHFFKDLNKLGRRELENLQKKRKKIKKNPMRGKHLSQVGHIFREPITDNIRLIYLVDKNYIIFLAIGTHKHVYKIINKRMHSYQARKSGLRCRSNTVLGE